LIRLLDVNVLLALCDESHEFHEAAWQWFEPRQTEGWVTCPITENGFVRIFGNPRYPGGPASLEDARSILMEFRQAEGHIFWQDTISVCDASLFPSLGGIVANGLTDLYLLGLVMRHDSRFATFDQRIDPGSLSNGAAALEIIVI